MILPSGVCTAQAVKLRLIIKVANIDIIFIAISLVYSCPDVHCKNQDHPLLRKMLLSLYAYGCNPCAIHVQSRRSVLNR